jgi:uncharacterized protein with FMN-binding domain
MQEENKSHGLLWGIVVVILGIVSFGAYKYMKKDTTAVETPVTPVVTTPTTPTPAVTSSGYKDGSYSAEGTYTSPGGTEHLDVKLTLKDGVITDAVVESLATRPESKAMQAKFISGYKTLVVGKKIDDVMLDKVSGSSLSPIGFNDAVAQIKVQAKA